MTPSRPYFIRAVYEWLLDNQLTPYIVADADLPYVQVPERFVEDGKIVLNIEPEAVGHLQMGNEAIEFDARFSGVPYHIYLPIPAVKAIYAFENGRGMVFNEEEITRGGDDDDGRPSPPTSPVRGKKASKPHLKIVK